MTKEYCVPENVIKSVEHIHGKYRIVVSEYSTKEGFWHYSGAKVYKNDLVVEVHRNYSSFPYLFIEGHIDGHDYLFCGEDYQGQTVVQLDTGLIKNYMSPGAEKGWGFCWASFGPVSPTGECMVIEGCYWAAPYEIRIIDIRTPMISLPMIFRDDEDLYSQPDEDGNGGAWEVSKWSSNDELLLKESWEGKREKVLKVTYDFSMEQV